MARTTQCKFFDLTLPDHDQCVGVVFTSVYEGGKPCDCACHTRLRCFAPYVAGHGVYSCDLHEGHGGHFHRRRLTSGGNVMWSARLGEGASA